MLDWASFVGDAVAAVIPEEHGNLRRPIAGALAVFLGGLPPARQEAILAEQAALPVTAPPSQRLAVLARACPTLHKLGQVLARDRRLTAELRQYLQELESLAASVPPEEIESIVAAELGPLGGLGLTLEPALAEASVAVVVPFRQGTQHGVFKVLKPGVVERLEQELALFERVGAYLDQGCDDFAIPHLDYQGVFEQVGDKLRHEVRFDLEQQHLVEARAIYAGDPRVLVPALFDLRTPRLTAMERVWGHKVTDPRHPDRAGWMANLVIETLIARPFFSCADQALFHGDPHAGNLLSTDDGRLALLDWSLAGRLGEPERVALVQLALAGLSFDSRRLTAVLQDLAAGRPADRPALETVVHAWLMRLRQGRLPGFTWLLGLLDEAVQSARLRVGADLLLFRKALHTLEGVVANIRAADGLCSPGTDGVLGWQFLQHLAVEWPLRWLAPPDSRAFATRVSNIDLGVLMLGMPLAMTRLWLDCPRTGTPVGTDLR